MEHLTKGLASCLWLLAYCGLCDAQNSSITGLVTDSSGASVVSVVIQAESTSGAPLFRSGHITAAGRYTVPSLPPGLYTLHVTAPGFQPVNVPDINLSVSEVKTIDVRLIVATLRSTVTVAATIAELPRTDTATGTVVSHRMISSLPLLTRNPYDLLHLDAGAVQSNSSLGGIGVNGARERSNNYLLDGQDNNDASVPGTPGGLIATTPDSTSEFRVITGTAGAQYGRNSGAMVDVTSRKGDNAVHGAMYLYGRHHALAARDPFNAGDEPENPFWRTTAGASLSGPIRNRTIVFGNAELQHSRTSLTRTSIVPTEEFRTGRFVYDGFNVDLTRPRSRNNPYRLKLDPTIQQVFSMLPVPNAEPVDDIRGLYRFPSASRLSALNTLLRVDHQLSAATSLTMRYGESRAADPNPFFTELAPDFGTIGSDSIARSIGLALTSAGSAVHELRAGLNRADASFTCGGTTALDQLRNRDQFSAGTDYQIEGISDIAGNTGVGCSGLGSSSFQSRRAGTWSVQHALSLFRSRHSFKIGTDVRYVFDDGATGFGSRPTLNLDFFSQTGTPLVNVNPARSCGLPDGEYCADSQLQNLVAALFGVAGSQAQSQFFDANGQRVNRDFRQFRQRELAAYAEDLWRVHQRLTITMGARYEYFGVPYERSGLMARLSTHPGAPETDPFMFEIVGPGTGRGLYIRDLNNVQPRVGLVWSLSSDGKTVLRAGYGIFHDRVFGSLVRLAKSQPFQQDVYATYDVSSAGVTLIPVPETAAVTAEVLNGQLTSPVLFERGIRNPMVQTWSGGLQQQLTRDIITALDYVGSKGSRLFRVSDGNPPQPAMISAHLLNGVAPTELQGTALYTAYPSVANTAFLQPGVIASISNSTYHSFQVRLTKRYSRTGEIYASYAWAHSIDDASDPLSPTVGNLGFPRNSLNLRQERGNSGLDVRHRAAVGSVLGIPIGGNLSGSFGRGVFNVLRNTQVSSLLTFQTGLPYDILGDRDNQHTGFWNRVDLIGNPYTTSTGQPNHVGPSLAAFALAPFGVDRVPTLGRNVFRGPGMFDIDIAVDKRISLSERATATVRVEMYNALNRTHYATPGYLLQDPLTFGVATATATRSDNTSSTRQVQVSVRLSF